MGFVPTLNVFTHNFPFVPWRIHTNFAKYTRQQEQEKSPTKYIRRQKSKKRNKRPISQKIEKNVCVASRFRAQQIISLKITQHLIKYNCIKSETKKAPKISPSCTFFESTYLVGFMVWDNRLCLCIFQHRYCFGCIFESVNNTIWNDNKWSAFNCTHFNMCEIWRRHIPLSSVQRACRRHCMKCKR